MPLDISNSAGFPWASCAITENRILYVRDTLALKRKKRNLGKHRYEFELTSNDMDLELGRKIKAKLAKAVDDTLSFVHPRLSFSQGVEPVEGVTMFTSEVAGTSRITMTSTGFWQVMAGDHITFSNDTKVYEIAEDTPLITGPQSVDLTFPLRKTAFVGTSVTMNNVAFELVSDGIIEIEMEASDGQDVQIVLNAVENL